MSESNLDCAELRRWIDLDDVDARADLVAVDRHLRECTRCRMAFPEVALLRGVPSRAPRVRKTALLRCSVAAAVLVAATAWLCSPIEMHRRDTPLATRAGRVRVLPPTVSSTTTTITEPDRAATSRASLTQQTVALGRARFGLR